MRVYVELPPEWGPGQVILAAWIRAGYHVDEVRSLGTGERRMVVHGGSAARGATAMSPTNAQDQTRK
ncbi:hypothetical protein [Actinomadura sp. 3N407]|uniref:hypothetical protein n=1 Tax=Actinomadura sp. 3N407 TaxID=3457423 RepID=UPI003FCD32DF